MKDNKDQLLSEEQMETVQGGLGGVKFQYRCLICRWTTRWSDSVYTIEQQKAQHEKDYQHYEWEVRESGGVDFGF